VVTIPATSARKFVVSEFFFGFPLIPELEDFRRELDLEERRCEDFRLFAMLVVFDGIDRD
jgi:hypothetical protein